jgi:hypothetical protein
LVGAKPVSLVLADRAEDLFAGRIQRHQCGIVNRLAVKRITVRDLESASEGGERVKEL